MRTTGQSSSKDRLKEIHKNMRQQYGFTRSEIKRFEKKVKKDPQTFRSMSQDELIAYIKKGRTASRLKRIVAFIALVAIIWFVFSRPASNRSGHNTTDKSVSKSIKTNIPSSTNTIIPLEEKTAVVITEPPPTSTAAPESTSSNEYNIAVEPTEKVRPAAVLETIPEKTEMPLISVGKNTNKDDYQVTVEETEKPTLTSEPSNAPEETDIPQTVAVNRSSPEEKEMVLDSEYYADISYMKGRGFSDYAGIEPNYVGGKGFAVVCSDEALENDKDFTNTPWCIQIYQMGDHGLVEGGYIEHKSQIGILDQYLEKKNGKEYQGYLLFVDFTSDMTGYIDVKNFTTVPYWNYDVIDSIEKGYGIAEYKQTSKYTPVLPSGNRVNINDNSKVLILEKGTYYVSVADKAHYPLVGIIFVEKNGRYEKQYVFFNVMDLKLIY